MRCDVMCCAECRVCGRVLDVGDQEERARSRIASSSSSRMERQVGGGRERGGRYEGESIGATGEEFVRAFADMYIAQGAIETHTFLGGLPSSSWAWDVSAAPGKNNLKQQPL